MNNNSILGIKIGIEKISEILAIIDIFLSNKPKLFFHIVNLNPDIFVLAYKNNDYRKIINYAQSIIIDGIGIKFASYLYGIKSGERMTGTDFLQVAVEYAQKNTRKVMFLGGKDEVSRLTGEKLEMRYPKLEYLSDSGADNIRQESNEEKERILEKISKYQPDFLFVAYGPPYQEKWIWENRENLKGIVCMGVGGAFNLISGKVRRAPNIIVLLGCEWLWRLVFEPKRSFGKFHRVIYFIILMVIKRIFTR